MRSHPACSGGAMPGDASTARRMNCSVIPPDPDHALFTRPPIAGIEYHNKAVVYGLLFDSAAETLLTIGADAKHLARLGVTLVLHTWGSSFTHHSLVHGVVPGGGLSIDSQRWVACRAGVDLHHGGSEAD